MLSPTKQIFNKTCQQPQPRNSSPLSKVIVYNENGSYECNCGINFFALVLCLLNVADADSCVVAVV